MDAVDDIKAFNDFAKDGVLAVQVGNAANITTTWKGDTVQPFEENDKNRCVIITGEGKFKVTKYETYEEVIEKTRKVEKTRTVLK